jgi:hypothetical protein
VVISKSHKLLYEHFNARQLKISSPQAVDGVEEIWTQQLFIHHSVPPTHRPKSLWYLHFSPTEFTVWLLSQNICTLCFNDASKWNLGVVLLGGVILGPRGSLESSYS